MNKCFLVSDIGGTHSRFSIFHYNSGNLAQLESLWFETDSYNSLSELLQAVKDSDLLKGQPPFSAVVVAAAGPVTKEGTCSPPNILWSLSLQELKLVFPESKVSLINDFLAQSYAVLTPLAAAAQIIKEGQENYSGVMAVLGPGTGLGKAMLHVQPAGAVLGLPSEGGHEVLPVIDKEDLDIVNFIKEKTNQSYVTSELLLSGRGLTYLYEYYYGKELEVMDVAQSIKAAKAPLIIQTYTKFLSRVCRDFSLNVYANMGLMIAGGVLTKTPEILNRELFRAEFENSATQEKFLKQVRVSNLCNEDSGLWGAAKYASQLL